MVSISAHVLLFTSSALAVAEAEELKEVVLARLTQVSSFSGQYSVSKVIGDDAFPIEAHTYRFQDDDRYSKQVTPNPDGTLNIKEWSRIAGYVTALGNSASTDPRNPPSGRLGHPKWPDNGSLINALHLFGYEKQKSMGEQLEGNEFFVRDGGRILTGINPETTRRIDIHVDEQFRVTKIVWGTAFLGEGRDRYVEKYGGDPFDLFLPTNEVELSDFVSIGGASVPTKASKLWLSQDKEEISKLKELKEAGKIDWQTMVILRCTEVSSVPWSIHALEMDVDTLFVNRPMSEEDFKIDFPDGAAIYDHILDRGFTVGEKDEPRLDNLSTDIVASLLNERDEDLAPAPMNENSSTVSPVQSAELTRVKSSNSISRRTVLTVLSLMIGVTIATMSIRTLTKRR